MLLNFLLNKDADADKNLISAVELKGRDPQNWMQAGGLLFDNKKYKEAGKLMKYAVSVYPEDFGVNLITGLSFAQIENPT